MSDSPLVARESPGQMSSAEPEDDHLESELGAETKSGVRILIADPDSRSRLGTAAVLKDHGYQVVACSTGAEALRESRRNAFEVVLIDTGLHDMPGLALLRSCLKMHHGTLGIVVSGSPTVSASMAAIREGAWDYLPKPFTAVQLRVLIGRAVHRVMARPSSRTPDAGVEGDGPAALLGRSSAFQLAVTLARKVAPTDAAVFLTGESGTGKEELAQFIHAHSRRRDRSMVMINCAALPESLLESEMFGHQRGAFTGAVRDKRGLLEVADGSTLLLDELTEMPQAMQAKLLRVIQDGVLRRVGSEGTDAVVDVRFIAATNRDPQKAIQQGLLRVDLFHRLSVVPIQLPPLRERKEDIPLLANHFLQRYWQRHKPPHSSAPALDAETLRALEARDWPGNVRELQNVMEHAVVLSEAGGRIDLGILSAAAPSAGSAPEATPPETGFRGSYHANRSRVLRAFEMEYLRWLLEQAGFNLTRAASIAGVDRTTLYRLMERNQVSRAEFFGD